MKISQLKVATLPLTGSEEFPSVQDGTTVRSSLSNIPLNATQVGILMGLLSSATTPLAGTETVMLIQDGILVTTAVGNIGTGSSFNPGSGTNGQVVFQNFSGNPAWTNMLSSADGRNSVDFFNRTLQGDSNDLSVDWSNRMLYGPGGTTLIMDWWDMLLNDESGQLAINWQSRDLVAANDSISINWNTRTLWDGSHGFSVMNWGTQQLTDTSGNISIDWGGRTLKDVTGRTSADWDVYRILYSADSNVSIDWEHRNLYDAGIPKVDWRNGMMYSGGEFSVDWGSRNLRSNGMLNLDWSGKGIVIIGDPDGDQNNTTLKVHDDTRAVDVSGQFQTYSAITFTGAGLNDIAYSETFTGPTTTTFTVTIDAVTTFTAIVTGASGPPPTAGDVFTTAGGAAGFIISMDTGTNILVYSMTSGSYAQPDLLTSGDWSATLSSQSTGPDMFGWTNGSVGGSYVACQPNSIRGSGVAISNGMTISFGSTTGHTFGDSWSFTVTAVTGRLSSVDFTTKSVSIGDLDAQSTGATLTVDVPDQRLIFTGNQVTINAVPYAFPSTQGSPTQTLMNDGSGNLNWAYPGTPLTSDVLSGLTTSAGLVAYTPMSGTFAYEVKGWLNLTVADSGNPVSVDIRFLDSNSVTQDITVLSQNSVGYYSFNANIYAQSGGQVIHIQANSAGASTFDVGVGVFYGGYGMS